MNNNIKNIIRTGVFAIAGLLAFYSCSDTWDEHYDPACNGTKVDATLYQQMKSDASLSDFVQIIDATGYEALLNENQIVTVFAPVNGTFNKDSLLAEISAGNKEMVIKRFVKNHIARYNYSSIAEEQEITLLNQKRTTLQNGVVGVDAVQAKSVNTICNNGILHVMNGYLPFHANIYETMEIDPSLSSLYNFFKNYDEDSLDIARSVYRGVDENGNRIYVDSVIITANDVMAKLDAYLFEEDSDYIAIMPTNAAFDARYEEIKNYFNYNIHEEDRDSLQELYANYYIVSTLFYNNNANLHPEDSLKSTIYSSYNPKYNVFYHPYEEGGILAPGTYTSKTNCSNGLMYKVDEIPTTIYDAFFHELEIECEHTGNINSELDANGNGKFTKTCNYETRATREERISKGGYLDAQPSSTSGQPYVAFNIANTLSGTYDMYLITVPLRMGQNVQDADTLKPYQFRVNMFYRTNKDTDLEATWPAAKNETLKNPADGGQNFISDPMDIDTIFLGTKTFTECYYNSDKVGVMLQVQSYVPSSATKTYSRRLLLDKILFKPHVGALEPEEVPVEVKKTPKH